MVTSTSAPERRLKPAMKAALTIFVLIGLVGIGLATHFVRVYTGPIGQVVIGENHIGYVNWSSFGVIYAHGSWTD